MSEQVWELIEIYGLLEKLNRANPVALKDVREYLISMLKQSISEKHEFHFRGSDGTNTHCKVEVPHAPHVVSHYETVRYGQLEVFCLGREGVIEIDGRKYRLNIVVENYSEGSPETPARADGLFYFEEIRERQGGDP